MNKKLLIGALSFGLLLTGCAQPSEEILAFSDYEVWLAGQNEVKNKEGEWVVNTWAPTEHNEMVATSLKTIYDLDKDVYNILKDREIEALYIGEVRVGYNEAGYTKKAIVDGEVKEFDGGMVVKGIVTSWNEEDQQYINEYWLPNPESGKGESLTPDSLFITPNHTSDPDANGFDHNTDPVCISGKGVYKYVFARYSKATEDKAVLGVGLIKVGE